MGILEHMKTHHSGGLVPKATTSKQGHGNKPLAKKKKQKEGLNVETGGDKEVPTPTEERKQRKQDTLEGISRTLGELVDSPRYEDIASHWPGSLALSSV